MIPRLIRDRVEIADVAFAAFGLRGLDPCAGASPVAFAQAAVERHVLSLIRFDIHELDVACQRRIEFVGREDVDKRGFMSAPHELTQTRFVAVLCEQIGEQDDESRAARDDRVVAHRPVEIRFALRLKIFEKAEQPRERGAPARGTKLGGHFAVLKQTDRERVARGERDRAESRREFQRVLKFIFRAFAPVHGLRAVNQNVNGEVFLFFEQFDEWAFQPRVDVPI